MTKDIEALEAGYADTLKSLYKVMLSSYMAAEGNKAMEKKADDSFKAGLALARTVRDKSLAFLA